MASALSAEFVARYARPPSETIVKQAISIHENVRAVFNDADYATLLQGSYKNDTALWDMNDVDIVAVSKNLVSQAFAAVPSGGEGVAWTEIFARIERKLQADPRYQGKWTRGDKCIRLNTGVKIDIVPAVRVGDITSDPISIFSFQAGRERLNWPRGHYETGIRKSSQTSGAYKQTVRLFKRWARCWFGSRKVAPSYYVECLVHTQPDQAFTGDLASDFVALGARMAQMQYGASTLLRLCGEGNLLVVGQWESASFLEFQSTLRTALTRALTAIGVGWSVTSVAGGRSVVRRRLPSPVAAKRCRPRLERRPATFACARARRRPKPSSMPAVERGEKWPSGMALAGRLRSAQARRRRRVRNGPRLSTGSNPHERFASVLG